MMNYLDQIIWKVECINKMLKINKMTASSLELINIHLFLLTSTIATMKISINNVDG